MGLLDHDVNVQDGGLKHPKGVVNLLPAMAGDTSKGSSSRLKFLGCSLHVLNFISLELWPYFEF